MKELDIKTDIISRLIHKNNKYNQILILLEIFKSLGYDKFIPKRELETKYTMIYFKNQLNTNNTEKTFNYIVDNIPKGCYIPGDVQRCIRTFYDNFKKYGLEQKGKNKSLQYAWNSNFKYNNIDNYIEVPRNLYKNNKEREELIKKLGNKCNICNSIKNICIDHWRSYSKYKIDDQFIAVLLCEICNNIHTNKDAILILKKNVKDIEYINNWMEIETKIREKYMPNEEDILLQNDIIDFITDYHIKKKNYSELIKKLETFKL